jgi:hypothetical protein
VQKRRVADEPSANLSEHDSWMLNAKIDGRWQWCYYNSRNEALHAFESLYGDYGIRLEDLEIVDPQGIFTTRGVVDALRICSKLEAH